MKVALLAAFVALSLAVGISTTENELDGLFKLKKLRDLNLIDELEFIHKKEALVNSYLGLSGATDMEPIIPDAHAPAPHNGTYHINITMTPQVQFLVDITANAMPRSYQDIMPTNGRSFWRSEKYMTVGAIAPNGTKLPLDDRIAIQERTLTHTGLNLYDGAVWTIALTLSGLGDLVNSYYRQILYPSSSGSNPQVDGLTNLRASNDFYKYGAKKVAGGDLDMVKLAGNMTQITLQNPKCCGECCAQKQLHSVPGAFFYRMIGPAYRTPDPLLGGYGYQWKYPYPDNDTTTPWNLAGIAHWNDWKPITGENVWGVILGPIQTMWLGNCSQIEKFDKFENAPPEIQFALSIMPALEALQSPLGAIYHCPKGTQMFPADPSEETNVSNENNFSAYAALKALKFILDNYLSSDTADPVLIKGQALTNKLVEGIAKWFASNLLSAKPIHGEYVIYQGGHISFDGKFNPQNGDQSFAVDCQTWGMTVLGQKQFDSWYGANRAYNVWQSTKKLAGYFVNGELAGVGYTTTGNVSSNVTNDIWSGEWTFGAINMVRKVALEYQAAGRADYHDSLMSDYKSMLKWITTPYTWSRDGVWNGGGLRGPDGAYLYANERFFIPWGWYANPIGATSSTGWAVMNEYLFNPFELGGGNTTTFFKNKCPGVKNMSPQFKF